MTADEALSLLYQYYPDDTPQRRILLHHSQQVRERALRVCDRHPELAPDRTLVEAGALLHDVGIFRCDAPGIHCHGTSHYLYHGVLGGELLRRAGEPQVARICERHTGTGLHFRHFVDRHLVPPQLLIDDPTDMALTPETIEEEIVCYADKFYSKSHLERERSIADTLHSIRKFGQDDAEKFEQWAARFE